MHIGSSILVVVNKFEEDRCLCCNITPPAIEGTGVIDPEVSVHTRTPRPATPDRFLFPQRQSIDAHKKVLNK